MPELPEVETVRRILDKHLRGKTIKEVRIFFNKIIKEPGVADFRKELIGQTIQEVDRRAKYLLFKMNDYVLISHLRMEGKYFLVPKHAEGDFKHVLVAFDFTDNTELRYHDTRRFGTMNLVPLADFEANETLNKLGYEPFDERLTVDYLKAKWHRKTIAIKTALLDQTVLSGIGNIYANEILFLARVNPTTPANQVTDAQLQAIIDNNRIVMRKAIDLGGTTISSYHPEPGVDGKFVNQLLVHMREQENCKVCSEPIIKYKLNGRGTYVCPKCQK